MLPDFTNYQPLTQQEKEELYQQYRDQMSSFCDKCGKAYKKKNINVIQKQDNAIVFHLACDYCQTNNFFYIIKPLGISNRMQINTDLNADEIKVFTAYPSISTNEIIDVYEAIENVPDAKSLIDIIS